MSGPQDMQGIAKMFGMPGGPAGPKPTMPIGQSTKRLGDARMPMSTGERPQRNPGQRQDEAARRLGVPREQVQPTGRPPQPQVQAPPPASLPRVPMPRPDPRGQEFKDLQIRGDQIQKYNFLTDPRSMPSSSRPEVNPNPVKDGQIPMPMGRPEGAGPRAPEAGPTGDPGQLNRMANALVGVLGGLLGGGGGSGAPKNPNAPPSSFGGSAGDMLAGLIGGGGGAPPKDPSKPSMSSAVAAPAPPNDPFAGGAAPIQAGPEQLMKVMAEAQRAKAEQSRPPVQAPESTRPSPNVTPPVPPGVPIPPPPSARPAEYTPSQPTFKGYEVRPREPKKGEEKDRTKALKKDNSLYYYSRVGAQQDDNSAVAQVIRKLREKAADPKTAKNITQEEDRILTQYSDFSKRGSNYAPNLGSMEPDAVAERMRGYKAGGASQIPDRYSDRPPGVDGGGGVPQLKLPPSKKKDVAADEVAKIIDNPPNRNATDPDRKIAVEDD